MPRIASRDTEQGVRAAGHLKSGQKSGVKGRGQNIF